VIQVLCRRRKNNPLLVAKPGRKTAIAEGLAWRIVKGRRAGDPGQVERLSLDMGALLAGTKSTAVTSSNAEGGAQAAQEQ